MEALDTIIENYYEYIGLIPNESRQEDQVFARSAMMVVLRDQMTLSQIGRIFGKDHSSVHHACKNHENNHNWSQMYRSFYEAAKNIVYENPISGFQLENKIQGELSRYKVLVYQLTKQLDAKKEECKALKKNNAILHKTLKECKLSSVPLQE